MASGPVVVAMQGREAADAQAKQCCSGTIPEVTKSCHKYYDMNN